jgi:hypothetical protein
MSKVAQARYRKEEQERESLTESQKAIYDEASRIGAKHEDAMDVARILG